MNRCRWCNVNNPLYVAYHDQEWGHLQLDDAHLFELLLLESFQAGLSWECILNKREAFRRAFDHFSPAKIAAYGEDKLNELAADATIVRNRRKLTAAVENAKLFLKLQAEYGSFLNYLKQYWNGEILYDCTGTHSALSDRLSADLRRRGMKFMGSVIVHSFLQAVGIVYAHDVHCDQHHRQCNCCQANPIGAVCKQTSK